MARRIKRAKDATPVAMPPASEIRNGRARPEDAQAAAASGPNAERVRGHRPAYLARFVVGITRAMLTRTKRNNATGLVRLEQHEASHMLAAAIIGLPLDLRRAIIRCGIFGESAATAARTILGTATGAHRMEINRRRADAQEALRAAMASHLDGRAWTEFPLDAEVFESDLREHGCFDGEPPPAMPRRRRGRAPPPHESREARAPSPE